MSKKFAHLSDNLITNVIVANTLADAEIVTNGNCVEIPNGNLAGIGWTYDSATKKFVAPPVDEPTVVEPKALGN